MVSGGFVKTISLIARLKRIKQLSQTSRTFTSRRERVSNNGAVCEFDHTEETFSVSFDELEQCLTKTGQKLDMRGICKRDTQVMILLFFHLKNL